MIDYGIDLLKTAVETATPSELTLMLYNGAVRFTNDTLEHMREGDDEHAENAIVRAADIIMELQIRLDNQYEISQPLYDLYQYMYRRLGLAMVELEKRAEIVSEVRDLLRELRDTWQKAMEKAALQNELPQGTSFQSVEFNNSSLQNIIE